MQTTDLATQDDRSLTTANAEDAAGALAHILGTGDLAKLSNEQRVAFYLDVCSSLGINPRTRPFDWIEFYDPTTKGKKLTLYPNQSCAAQLRRQHQISIRVMRREPVGELFVVEVEGTTPNGRTGTASKYVSVVDGQGQRLRGTQLANAYMKAETGAQRRLTFSMVGMVSPPDIDELQRPRVVVVDGRGNVLDHPSQEQRYLAENPGAAKAIGEPIYEDAGATTGPLDGAPDQRVTDEELTPQKRASGDRPSLRPTKDAVDRLCGAWFQAVKDTTLDADAERHAFVRDWTARLDGWPTAKQTDSLRTFFGRATEREAGDFLAYVRDYVQAERDAEVGADDETGEAF